MARVQVNTDNLQTKTKGFESAVITLNKAGDPNSRNVDTEL
jgi:hypothetical protein